MIAASVVSSLSDPQLGARDCALRLRRKLAGQPPAGIFFFATLSSAAALQGIATVLAEELDTFAIAGSTGLCVMTESDESDAHGTVVALAFAGPIQTRGILVPLRHGGASAGSQVADLLARLDAPAAVVTGCREWDDVEEFLREVRFHVGERLLVGGLATAPLGGDSAVAVGREARRRHVAAAALCGKFQVEVIVTHGCEPLGKPMYITDGQGFVIRKLEGRTALEVLEESLARISPLPKRRLLENVMGGFPIEPAWGIPGRGDYVVRGILGIEAKEGSVRVGHPVAPGMQFCFLHRDPVVARLDLQERLEEAQRRNPRPVAFGLYFDCLSRGPTLHGEGGVDRAMIRSVLGEFPLVGVRTGAEIAPLGRRTAVLHQTGVLVLFRPAS